MWIKETSLFFGKLRREKTSFIVVAICDPRVCFWPACSHRVQITVDLLSASTLEC